MMLSICDTQHFFKVISKVNISKVFVSIVHSSCIALLALAMAHTTSAIVKGSFSGKVRRCKYCFSYFIYFYFYFIFSYFSYFCYQTFTFY
jgi:hypothetical protein